MPCSAAEFLAVSQLVGSNATATTICGSYAVTDMGGSTSAVLAWTVSQLQGVREQLADTTQALAESSYGLNTLFVLISAALVFMMQLGFAMFVAGTVRSKNISSILMKSFIDTCITAVGFYTVGYGFARGHEGPSNGFIGDDDFALSRTTSQPSGEHRWDLWLWEWVFCAASATIMAGAVAERGTFISYTIWIAFYSMFVYPVVAYWHWNERGWLSAANNKTPILGMGAIDFAGSGVVHTQGGFASLVAAIMLGPRIGRYGEGVNTRMYKGGHNPPYYLLGTFFLWLGWYGFNPGSTLDLQTFSSADIAARTAVTTTLSAGSGGIVALLLVYWRTRTWDMFSMCTGVLGGLVAITGGCSVVEPWAAVLCGSLSAPWVVLGDDLMDRLQIDDPCQAFPMHGMAGIWGMLFVGLLGKESYIVQVYGKPSGKNLMGLFYGGHGQLLLCQFIAVVVVIAWVCFWSGLFFWTMKKLGLLRVHMADEAVGLDASAMADHHAAGVTALTTKIV
ncbi:putative ammonium transporter [Haematococcus lacustris]